MQGRLVAGAELSGGLHDDADAELAPVDLRGIAAGQNPDRGAVDDDRIVGVGYRRAHAAVGRIEREQVRESPGVRDVVHGDDLDIVPLERPAHERTSDAPEAVDSDADGHDIPSWLRPRLRLLVMAG